MDDAMKLRFGLMSIVILASIWILPTELAGAEPSGDPPRVIVLLVLLDAPSGLQTTTDLGSLGTIISHQSLLTPGDMVFLEAWCRTPGPHGITTAVIDVTYQTTFLNTSVAQVSLAQQWAGVLPFTVSVDDEAGVIGDLGGNNFSGLGAGEWARIGTIEFDVTGTPADPVQFCSLFAGETPDGIPLEFAIWSEGAVDPSEVEYGCYWVGCSADANCHDGDACTDDSCDPGLGCLHSATDCDDGNVCTVDTCDPSTGCDNDGTGITIACDDGDACTTGDVCQGDAVGTCEGTDTSAVNCNDGNVCTDDSCDPVTGCLHVDNTDPCDDGDACTTNDMCSDGACVGGPPLDCDDQNVCTDDSCDPASGCVHVNNTDPCDDGDTCTTDDMCLDGTCIGGPPLDCDDQNVCTNDSCDPVSGCVHVNNTDPCDDGDACTTNDMCSDGTCVGGPPLDCDDQNVCTDDSCDPGSGCVNTPVPGRECDDSDACTTQDTCDDTGACIGGPPPDCDDGNVCTDDSCDPGSGCVHAPLDCDDGNPCTDDSCDPEIGCIHTPVDGHPEMIIVEIPGLTGAYDWDIQRDAEVSLGFSLFDIGCVAIQWSGWINTGTFECFGTLQGLGGQFDATFIPESFAGASFEERDGRANFTIPFERTDPVQLQPGGTFDFLLDGSADIRVSFPPYFQKCLIVYSPIGMLSSVSLVIAAHRMHDFDADGAVDLDDMNAFDSCMGGPEDQLAIGCEVFDSDRDVDVDLADFAAFQVEFTGEP